LVETGHVKKGHKTVDFGARIPGNSAACDLSFPKKVISAGRKPRKGMRVAECGADNSGGCFGVRKKRQMRSAMTPRENLSRYSWRTAKASVDGKSW
jgi:hypothetical protein